MNLIDLIIGCGIGLTAGLVIHAVYHTIAEHQHQADLLEEREQGRRTGYDQCWKEMVRPLSPRHTPANQNRPIGNGAGLAMKGGAR